eukprot:bmy_11837T0
MSFSLNFTLPANTDCGPSLGLAAGIPSLVATALLVALLFTLIHQRRSSSESTEVISSFFGSGSVGKNRMVSGVAKSSSGEGRFVATANTSVQWESERPCEISEIYDSPRIAEEVRSPFVTLTVLLSKWREGGDCGGLFPD